MVGFAWLPQGRPIRYGYLGAGSSHCGARRGPGTAEYGGVVVQVGDRDAGGLAGPAWRDGEMPRGRMRLVDAAGAGPAGAAERGRVHLSAAGVVRHRRWCRPIVFGRGGGVECVRAKRAGHGIWQMWAQGGGDGGYHAASSASSTARAGVVAAGVMTSRRVSTVSGSSMSAMVAALQPNGNLGNANFGGGSRKHWPDFSFNVNLAAACRQLQPG